MEATDIENGKISNSEGLVAQSFSTHRPLNIHQISF